MNETLHMPFATTTQWREPKDHLTDYYFCLPKISRISSTSRHTIVYSSLWSATKQVLNGPELPINTQSDSSMHGEESGDEAEN